MLIFNGPPPSDDGLDADTKILVQLPPQDAQAAWNMDEDFPVLGDKDSYSTEPANIRVLSLMKSRYDNRKRAMLRAREICLGTGERLHRFFETGRAWVAHVYRPLKPGEGFK